MNTGAARRVLSGVSALLPSRRTLYAVAVLLVLAHVLLVFRHYPLSILRSGEPLCTGDLGIHFAGCSEGRQLLSNGGRLWGYSPSFMAGYPFGAWDSFSRRGYEYASLLFPGCSAATAFYWYVILTALLPPFLLALAAGILGLGRREILLCLCLAVVIYQVGDPISYLWTFGNVAFPFVTCLAVLYFALAVAGIQRRKASLLAAAGLLLGLIFWLHQLATIPTLAGSLFIP